jgi:protein-S-isoprenylcysteine O-methyltransferase Ste14
VDILNWLAIGLFFGLGIWSVAVLGIRRSFLYRHIDDPLIKTGPYALMRHPQFLSARGITFFGIQLFNPNSFSFTVYGDLGANWSLFTLALWGLSIIEEGELISHFGDEYRDYIQRVPRLFPN